MTLRKALLIPLLISLAFFVYFSSDVHSSLRVLSQTLHWSVRFAIVIFICIVLQLIGHMIRAYKAKVIFGVAKESSFRFQFRALSLGYLFDTVLPFRFGELIRARVISGAMTISFGYAIMLVVFERLLDILVLAITGGLLLLGIQAVHSSSLGAYSLALGCIGIGGAFIYILIASQNQLMLKAWYQFTILFNERLKTEFRFKAWTIIYGMQQTLRLRILVRYIGLTILSWMLYGASLLILAIYIVRHVSPSAHITAAVAPYYGISIPAGPASLGIFSRTTDNLTSSLHLTSTQDITYDLVAWAVLVIPIALIGIVLLFTKTRELLFYDRPRKASADSLTNKLYRTENISSEMEVFLENYFSGNSLSRVVHNLEVQGAFTLVKYFKGGSDAITILVNQHGQQVVKKIIPHEFEDRLKAQYDWLRNNSHKQGIVKALDEYKLPQYYAIDLEYDPANEMYYEFIHSTTLSKSKQVLDDVWKILSTEIYRRLPRQEYHPTERKKYIDRHVFGCLEKAAAVDPELIRAAAPEAITINGVQYDNLYQIMHKIEEHEQAWRDIATYRESKTVHGDVIVDNLLVSRKTKRVLIIDPAPDGNIIQGPVFDFGKNLQSLYCGYETLLRDEDKVYLIDGDTINYRDQISSKYRSLAHYVQNELAPRYLTESERRAMLFHAACLYIRRLKHQVYYTPGNALKFYAVGVKTLNEFLAQYED